MFADNILAPGFACAHWWKQTDMGPAVDSDSEHAYTSLLKALTIMFLTCLSTAVLAHEDVPGFGMVK